MTEEELKKLEEKNNFSGFDRQKSVKIINGLIEQIRVKNIELETLYMIYEELERLKSKRDIV